jgi:hypothetical protein
LTPLCPLALKDSASLSGQFHSKPFKRDVKKFFSYSEQQKQNSSLSYLGKEFGKFFEYFNPALARDLALLFLKVRFSSPKKIEKYKP